MSNLPVFETELDEAYKAELKERDKEIRKLKSDLKDADSCIDRREKMINHQEEQIEELQSENNQLESLVEKLKLEAQIHAGEDDTHKSIQLEIYQALGIQKGDWNGAKPVIEEVNQLKARVGRLESRIKRAWIDNDSESTEYSPADFYGMLHDFQDILDESPQQSLVDLQVEAVQGFSSWVYQLSTIGWGMQESVEGLTNDYIKQLKGEE